MSRPRSILEDPVGEPSNPASDPSAVTAPDPTPATDAVCPRCGAPLRADQDWCLGCGTAVTTRVTRPSGWRAPFAIVALVLTIALVSLVAAFLAVSDDPDQVAQAGPGAAQQPAAPTPAPAPVTPTPEPDPINPDTIPPATGGDDPPPTDDEPSGGTPTGVGSWPSGESAWTVVLLSSPSRAGARSKARTLSDGGTEVGVLDSDDFKSLRGGYFVVFSGQYDSQASAESALAGLKAEAPQAYVRRVTPR